MLRITIHEAPRTLTFRLEGRLAGPWARELDAYWRAALAKQPQSVLRVDLTDVTAIDTAGRGCLESMHRSGAEFVATDCLMKAIVAEITRSPAADCKVPAAGEGASPAKYGVALPPS
jgi:hypothetical protein